MYIYIYPHFIYLLYPTFLSKEFLLSITSFFILIHIMICTLFATIKNFLKQCCSFIELKVGERIVRLGHEIITKHSLSVISFRATKKSHKTIIRDVMYEWQNAVQPRPIKTTILLATVGGKGRWVEGDRAGVNMLILNRVWNKHLAPNSRGAF